ncbi:MAG: type II secretion system F family protein [Desulfobulbaceae bacterium]|nr:type II secretion system F family protein [Desulfobulbaceae bacterium]
MMNFFIPFFAFLVVMVIMLLGYSMWAFFFDPRNKAKKQRLEVIQNTIHSVEQSISSTTESEIESWLSSRSGTFRKLQNLVERAHSPLKAGRFMVIMLILFAVVFVLGLLRQTNPILILALAAAISSTPLLWLSRQSNQRRLAFESKLPEMLDFISRALRAGHSLTSALCEVGKEFTDPIGPELKTVSDEMAFGIPFKDAIGRLADRVQSKDLSFFVTSLVIQHETGGNLAELLDGLAETMRERFKLRGKIRTLSAEGRASAFVLGGMPFAFASILTLINPGYISILWTTPQGQTLLLICGGLMAAGIFVLNSIIQIKV